jgi:hypothetical protein
MRDSTALPDLHMLPTEILIPHEDYDPRRIDRLSQRLQEEGILKNPPIIAAIPGEQRYVVLDGANRVISFTKLGIPHIVAQQVSYDDPGVCLDTWYHVVSGMPLDEFEGGLAQVAGMQLVECTLQEARRALESEEAMAYIITQEGVRKVPCPHDCQPHDLHLLNSLVGAYKGKADIYRASNDSWELQAPTYPHITALVIFPRYRPKDILQAAQNSYRFPSGITRHVIPNRALNINIPLEILAADRSLEQKRQWLQDWLIERLAANAIRYYAEPTFSFNE